jgi:hypothetical protein
MQSLKSISLAHAGEAGKMEQLRGGSEQDGACGDPRDGGEQGAGGDPERRRRAQGKEDAGESEMWVREMPLRGDTDRRTEGQKGKLVKFYNVTKVGLEI